MLSPPFRSGSLLKQTVSVSLMFFDTPGRPYKDMGSLCMYVCMTFMYGSLTEAFIANLKLKIVGTL